MPVIDEDPDPVEPDPGSNAADDGEGEILEDYDGDATEENCAAPSSRWMRTRSSI